MPRARPPAFDAAVKLLAGRDYAWPEMQAKLAQRQYAEEEIAAALETLARYGYIQQTGTDRAQLERMADAYLAKRATRTRAAAGAAVTASALHALEAFLLRKGFDPDLVAAHLTDRAETTGRAAKMMSDA